jgi:hypothetical protein
MPCSTGRYQLTLLSNMQTYLGMLLLENPALYRSNAQLLREDPTHYGRMDDTGKFGASHASLPRGSFDQDQSSVSNNLSRTRRLDKVVSDELKLY